MVGVYADQADYPQPRTRAADKAPADADPEFLALTERQRAAIDRVFARGVAQSSGRKKRRLNKNTNAVAGPSGTGRSSPTADAGGFVTDDAGEGGFVDDRFEGEGGFMDAGGFMPEDDGVGAGGFMPEGEDDEGGGGFMDDTSGDQAPGGSTTNPQTPKARIPLRLIPSLLSALKLPFDDDVLDVFRASASGWQDDDDEEGGAGPSRRKRPQETEDGVELKDFRAVCAALMGPDDGADFDLGDDPEPIEDAADMSSDDDEDMYESESDSALSSLSSDSEFGAKRPAKRPGKGAKGKSAASMPGKSTPDRSERAASKPGKRLSKKAVALQAASGTIKLSSRQKDGVRDIWEMLKPEAIGRGSHILGRDEVKKWVRDLGEMWTDDEITDMVKLFSSQHEGRGLSYDDFGIVMARAGLV